MKRMIRVGVVVMCSVAMSCTFGCGGDAHLELAAADALDTAARELDVSFDEYHAELARMDDAREAGVVEAFIDRVRVDHEDDAKTAGHEEAFREAMRRIRADRGTERERYANSRENVSMLREVASGLRRLAIESLSLEDEMRRYLESWMERMNTPQPERESMAPTN